MKESRQIIAMGGGGFSMEPDNPLLDRYVLENAGADCPNVCFLPTASGDADGYLLGFYKAFSQFDCRPTHLSLFALPTSDLLSFVLEQDVIYVGGGNTRSMLALWAEWGLDSILRTAWEQGVVMAGLSAGSICWFEEGLSDFFPGELNVVKALGLLSGSHNPHYDGEPLRRPRYRELIAQGAVSDGIAADDGVALHYRGTELHAVVSSRPEGAAYRVRNTGEGVEEERIEPVRLR